MDKLHETYCMMLEVHQTNIQILKNQKTIMQHQDQNRRFPATETELNNFKKSLEETDNILRMITSGKYKA